MDAADEAGDLIDLVVERQLAANREALERTPKGNPGECYECGEDKPRVIHGVCVACIDDLKAQGVKGAW